MNKKIKHRIDLQYAEKVIQLTEESCSRKEIAEEVNSSKDKVYLYQKRFDLLI